MVCGMLYGVCGVLCGVCGVQCMAWATGRVGERVLSTVGSWCLKLGGRAASETVSSPWWWAVSCRWAGLVGGWVLLSQAWRQSRQRDRVVASVVGLVGGRVGILKFIY